MDYNGDNLAYDETTNVLYLVALNKAGDKYLGRVKLNWEYCFEIDGIMIRFA